MRFLRGAANLLGKLRFLHRKAIAPSMRITSLTNYLSTPRPGYAFAISARWGAGKSYFWERYGSDHLPSGMSPIRISCAGLSSLEDLERALLSQMISIPAPVKELATIAGKALLRIIQVDPEDIKVTPEVLADKHVVVLDDIERFNGECKTLFGFVINLLDSSGVHAVLLVDEERAAQTWPNDFSIYRERVIGASTPLSPDVEAFALSTLNGFASRSHRETLTPIVPHVISRLREAKITNLRTVRVLFERFKDVLTTLEISTPAERLPQLLFATTFWVLVSRERHDSLSAVRALFLHGDFSLAIAMREARSNQRENDGPESEVDAAIAAIKHFRMWEDCFEWNSSPAFVRLMDGLEVDGNHLFNEFQLGGYASGRDPLDLLARPLELSDSQLQGCIALMFEELESGRVQSIGRLQKCIEVLFYLCDLGLTREDETELEDRLARVVHGYPRAALKDVEPYPFIERSDSASLLRIRALVRDLQIVSEQEQNEAAAHAARAYWYTGRGDDPGRSHVLLFPEDEADVIANLLVAAVDASATRRVLSVLRERLSVTNSREFVNGDYVGALKVADQLAERSVAGDRPSTVAAASLKLLERMIRSYAAHIGP